MHLSSIHIRPATTKDADHLASLINYAGEGFPVYLWEKMKDPSETVWDVGIRRAMRDEGSFSWSNATIAEIDGEVAGCLIGYRLNDEPEEIDYEEMPAMFVPLQELENLCPGTWYVNVLATYPEHRNKGLGSELLREAENLANQTDSQGLSIIVSDGNDGARRLYVRAGYQQRDTRPMVKENWRNRGNNWVLLVKDVD